MYELNESTLEIVRTDRGGYTGTTTRVLKAILQKRGLADPNFKKKGWIKRVLDHKLWITEQELDYLYASRNIYTTKNHP